MSAQPYAASSGKDHLLAELNEKNELLQSIYDTNLIGMSVLEAERDEAGNIEDFRIKVVNNELQKLTGRTDLVDRLYAQEFPGIKQTELFDLMLEVMETGMARQLEYSYQRDGFDCWFSSMFVKVGDGLVATNLDITGRKLMEVEKLKVFTLLEQTEALAETGSWEFNSAINKFTWSKGMYRLFELDLKTKVTPEIFLQYAAKESDLIANRIVDYIESGKHNFEETIEVLVLGRSKILKIRASIMHGADENRMVGVAMDITRQIELQQEKESLENRQKELEALQSKKIFQAGLNAQEEERKRIAETLHNGIGQLLYAVKMSLSMVDLKKNADHASLYQAKQATEQLLADAIRESRRISHVLSPIILEDLGLEAAISDVCRQFESTISIEFKFTGLKSRLDKYVEISVYRMVQELVMNIVKHANATQATVQIDQQEQDITLIIRDNGTGFDFDQVKDSGLGLQTIYSKVRLLNGVFDIKVQGGTQITITLPHQLAR